MIFLLDLLRQGLQWLLVLAIAPLLIGWIRKVKARILRRQGPSIIQPWRDILRLFRKEVVIAITTSFRKSLRISLHGWMMEGPCRRRILALTFLIQPISNGAIAKTSSHCKPCRRRSRRKIISPPEVGGQLVWQIRLTNNPVLSVN